jgi:hypothetical protein
VGAGDRIAGFKLGNIAKAMQAKFGVDEPDYRWYLLAKDGSRLPDDRPFRRLRGGQVRLHRRRLRLSRPLLERP